MEEIVMQNLMFFKKMENLFLSNLRWIRQKFEQLVQKLFTKNPDMSRIDH